MLIYGTLLQVAVISIVVSMPIASCDSTHRDAYATQVTIARVALATDSTANVSKITFSL